MEVPKIMLQKSIEEFPAKTMQTDLHRFAGYGTVLSLLSIFLIKALASQLTGYTFSIVDFQLKIKYVDLLIRLNLQQPLSWL